MANILLFSVQDRKKSAMRIQEILTNSGCRIKTRLGLHPGDDGVCSDSAVIILDIAAKESELSALVAALGSVEGVKVELVKF